MPDLIIVRREFVVDEIPDVTRNKSPYDLGRLGILADKIKACQTLCFDDPEAEIGANHAKTIVRAAHSHHIIHWSKGIYNVPAEEFMRQIGELTNVLADLGVRGDDEGLTAAAFEAVAITDPDITRATQQRSVRDMSRIAVQGLSPHAMSSS